MGTDADVAVVGYGPVGAALAVLLGQMGRSVVVLERWDEPYPLPRAVHFDHEVGRILGSCGVGDDLRSISLPGEIYEWRNAAGRTLLRFGRVGDGPSGWPLSSMFHQPALEALLDRRARQLAPVRVLRGREVTSLAQDRSGVTLQTAGGGEVRARYGVGCDGANSTVRTLADLPACDLGFHSDWLVVDVVLGDARTFDPLNLQVCDPRRPTTVVSGGPGRRRWEFMRLPGEQTHALDRESRAWELLAPWDVHPGNARLERHTIYTFRARYAERWRAGRVLLAGDAAHLTPPFAGQGLCAGMRDVANLAWKLDLVLDGRTDERLLDTYEQERLPHAKATIEFGVELGKVICVADLAEAEARDEAMIAAVGPQPVDIPDLPGPSAGLIAHDSPHAGELFVQPRTGGRLMDQLHGPGWRLVTPGGNLPDLDPEQVSWLASIGGAALAIDRDDRWTSKWFAERQVAWALQRPDFHLYGTAPDAAAASLLLADLRHRLTGRGFEGTQVGPVGA